MLSFIDSTVLKWTYALRIGRTWMKECPTLLPKSELKKDLQCMKQN
jgi:hypothetical protein